ncbi:rCG41969 [Rattus norvegicus]|uniref:RCG41969 n=1 Tax=Rattus norvegicus TaxID=10116 RepID=A6JV15_RAT|nr:rCG41969 [Rattus norvegicus]
MSSTDSKECPPIILSRYGERTKYKHKRLQRLIPTGIYNVDCCAIITSRCIKTQLDNVVL